MAIASVLRSRLVVSVLCLTQIVVSIVLGNGLAARSAEAASGSDLGFGYTWRDTADGAVFESVAFTPAVLRLNPPDDAVRGPFPLSFPAGFGYYGFSFTSFYISDNGWLSFVDPGMDSGPMPAGIPSLGVPSAFLAPFFAAFLLDFLADLLALAFLAAFLRGFAVRVRAAGSL